jgi:hypothetical protein
MKIDGFDLPYVTDSMHPGISIGAVVAVLVLLAMAVWAVRVGRSRKE